MDNVTPMSQTEACPAKVETVGVLGPMETAWKQTFQDGLNGLAPLLVIVWHSEWMRLDLDRKWNPWKDLHEKLAAIREQTKILVVIFGATPNHPGLETQGNPLTLLLQAIAADTAASCLRSRERRVGWVSISEISRFASAAVEWKPTSDPNDSALLRLCSVCAMLCQKPSAERKQASLPVPLLNEFFLFLEAPTIYRARQLHAAQDDPVKGLRVLKWLAAYAMVPRSLPLNILLVENKPDDLKKANARALAGLERLLLEADGPLGFLKHATIYLLDDKDKNDVFQKLRTEDGRDGLRAKIWQVGPQTNEKERAVDGPKIPWKELDLILQDIVLDDEAKLTGLELASHYFEACPQALVFLLTSLDVESLVGSGDVNWRYVDCIVSKKAMATLWYEYRRCFQERFGRIMWADWPKANPTVRKLLRSVFASLRRWQIEPDILWHGQSLPEMIDHANRHITALWRLTNDFLGTLLENGGADEGVLSIRHRVALTLAVWMHDVGHRGDEYVAGSMDIRASHAGISERLLLRNPDAYGLGWLLHSEHMPHKPCRSKFDPKGREARLECRNQVHCSGGNKTSLCLLREVGLLCRHHQSNAPLDMSALTHMAGRGKSPAVYSLVPDSDDKPLSSEEFLRGMTNEALPMPSARGTKVRTLRDFVTSQPDNFRCVAGLLRMLDALQLHRTRVGTSAFDKSFIEFLETKFAWCKSERDRLETNRRSAMEGRSAFQRVSGKIHELDEYEILLKTQQVHSWRQAAVHDVEVRWTWEPGGKAAAEILFILNERALADLGKKVADLPISSAGQETLVLSNILPPIKPLTSPPWPSGVDLPVRKWIYNVKKEVIGSEHESQYPISASKPEAGYLGVLLDDVQFRVGVAGTDRKAFSVPHYIFVNP